MNHESAFFTKLAFIEVVELTLLLATGATFAQAFSIGMVTAAVIYVLGDLIILPSTSNIAATCIDGLLAFVLNWSASLYTDARPVAVTTAVLVSIAVMVFEFISHRGMIRQLTLT